MASSKGPTTIVRASICLKISLNTLGLNLTVLTPHSVLRCTNDGCSYKYKLTRIDHYLDIHKCRAEETFTMKWSNLHIAIEVLMINAAVN